MRPRRTGTILLATAAAGTLAALSSCVSSAKVHPGGSRTATPTRLCVVTPNPTHTPGAPVMSYATHVRPIFTVFGCNDCHGSQFPASLYRPSFYSGNGASWAGIVEAGDLARKLGQCDVIRGDGLNSLLVRKLVGAPGIPGSRMPPGGSPTVNPTQIANIIRWIDQGAPDN